MAALDGIRVIDLTQFEAGTSCTQNLAWLGADVIKIERPGEGEPGRNDSPLRSVTYESSAPDAFYFVVFNSNKRGVTIDLRSDKGREILFDLCKEADVFVENFGPGTIEKLGFDYKTLSKLNPRLIYAQVKGFSAGSPYESFKVFESIATATGGALSVTGTPDGPPILVKLADMGSGLHLTVGILAALVQRESTGRGQQISVAMQEAIINLNRISYARTLKTGKAAVRQGNSYATTGRPEGLDLYPTLPAGDGGPANNDYCVIRLTDTQHKRQWEGLVELLGRPELLEDERFSTPAKRRENASEIEDLVTAWTLQHPKEEAMNMLQAIGFVAGAVFDSLELMNDPFLNGNGTFATINHPAHGSIKVPGFPIHMSDSSVPVVPAPLISQHTREVLSEVLHKTAAEIDDLEQSGVI